MKENAPKKQYPEAVKNPIQKFLFNSGVRKLGQFYDARAAEGEEFGPKSFFAEEQYDDTLGTLAQSVRKFYGNAPKEVVAIKVSGQIRDELKRRSEVQDAPKPSGTIFKRNK